MHKIPKVMRAAAIDRFGGPEVLSIHSIPVPDLDAREVLIAMHTAGVGVWDAEMREGRYTSGSERFPLVLGTDGAGTIVASRINVFNVGDQVYSYSFDNPKGGFYAEYVAVASEKVAPIPERLDLEHAGAIPTTGLTALQGIDDVLHVTAGETLIIHGASGGVGSLAIQFAKWRGARVLATARGEDGLAFVRHLGADLAVEARGDDIAAAARFHAPGGIDAVLGLAGGDAFERCIDTLRPGGRVAYPNGVQPVPNERPGIEITPYDAIAGIDEFERLNRAVEAAELKVPIAAAYALDHAARAHERLAEGHVRGKLVLQVR
ncbi:MAG: NADPH:quinone reductase [Planctomycetota bacterium]|nr:NADPH:quinone reductase [Planctomycetota bacterium]